MARTDRTLEFYKGPDNPHSQQMHDALMTYCMYDFDLGEFIVIRTSSCNEILMRRLCARHE